MIFWHDLEHSINPNTVLTSLATFIVLDVLLSLTTLLVPAWNNVVEGGFTEVDGVDDVVSCLFLVTSSNDGGGADGASGGSVAGELPEVSLVWVFNWSLGEFIDWLAGISGRGFVSRVLLMLGKGARVVMGMSPAPWIGGKFRLRLLFLAETSCLKPSIVGRVTFCPCK